jgi:hypothetical protein
VPRQQQYVFCPFCNDPVPGPFTGLREFLECSYCTQTFPFDAQAVQTALIGYHETERRWVVVPIHTEMDAQTARILDFCNQSAPGCIVHITPLGPDSFTLKVKDGDDVLVASDVALYTHEVAAKSDEDLWKLLEKLSDQRITQKQ